MTASSRCSPIVTSPTPMLTQRRSPMSTDVVPQPNNAQGAEPGRLATLGRPTPELARPARVPAATSSERRRPAGRPPCRGVPGPRSSSPAGTDETDAAAALLGCEMKADGDLAVVGPPQRPGVLARDADRRLALLREARVVDDQRLHARQLGSDGSSMSREAIGSMLLRSPSRSRPCTYSPIAARRSDRAIPTTSSPTNSEALDLASEFVAGSCGKPDPALSEIKPHPSESY